MFCYYSNGSNNHVFCFAYRLAHLKQQSSSPFSTTFVLIVIASFLLDYHQSNGRAEASIKSMIKLVIGSRKGGQVNEEKLAKAILLFSSTPRYGGASPAHLVLVFNRHIWNGIPAHRRSFAPVGQRTVLEERVRRALELSTDR